MQNVTHFIEALSAVSIIHRHDDTGGTATTSGPFIAMVMKKEGAPQDDRLTSGGKVLFEHSACFNSLQWLGALVLAL